MSTLLPRALNWDDWALTFGYLRKVMKEPRQNPQSFGTKTGDTFRDIKQENELLGRFQADVWLQRFIVL